MSDTANFASSSDSDDFNFGVTHLSERKSNDLENKKVRPARRRVLRISSSSESEDEDKENVKAVTQAELGKGNANGHHIVTEQEDPGEDTDEIIPCTDDEEETSFVSAVSTSSIGVVANSSMEEESCEGSVITNGRNESNPTTEGKTRTHSHQSVYVDVSPSHSGISNKKGGGFLVVANDDHSNDEAAEDTRSVELNSHTAAAPLHPPKDPFVFKKKTNLINKPEGDVNLTEEIITSTPFSARNNLPVSTTNARNLDFSANISVIPGDYPSSSHFNVTLSPDEITHRMPLGTASNSDSDNDKDSGDTTQIISDDDQGNDDGAKGNDKMKVGHSNQHETEAVSQHGTITLEDDIEDVLISGIEDIAINKNSEIHRGKNGTGLRNKRNSPIGATAAGYYDDSDDEDFGQQESESENEWSNGSANFDFIDDEAVSVSDEDSGRGDSTNNHKDRRQERKGQKSTKSVFSSSSSSVQSSPDEIQILSEKLRDIPLGTKQGHAKTARKAIFLDEPPPHREVMEKKTYCYDPTNLKHQEFYGDVRRTVTLLANTIESMPMPGGDETEDGAGLDLPEGLVQLYDHQKYGLRWLLWREGHFPSGGILADEMGLGKTIMIIALIMKSKLDAKAGKSNDNWIDSDETRNCILSKTTLVVCPVGCLLQWEEEIKSKGRGLKVEKFHGSGRTSSAAKLAQADVVLTTYSTVGSEIPKDDDRYRNKSPLTRIYWRRIVLDEAHNVRNPKTVSAQAVSKLLSRHRWAVTGTPVHNRPEDFFSMVKFLRMVPFDDPKVWDFWIGLKQLRKSNEAQERMHTIGKALILRRTKEEVEKTGGNVKAIPPKTVEIVELELSEEERRVYEHLVAYSKTVFKDFLINKEQRDRELQAAAFAYTAGAGSKKKKANFRVDLEAEDEVQCDVRFSHIFVLIMRMRQCAVLPGLIKGMLEDEEIDDDESFDPENENHVISKRNPIFDDFYLSAKFKRILEDLEKLRMEAEFENRPMDKVVIVSQWTVVLDILYQHLQPRKFSCVFITGREKTEERRDAQKLFNREGKRPQIVLLSLNAGGVGINLVGGNRVFFIEPHWNPQLELQAQDRVHRFGQTKDVYVTRYVTLNSIEDRIIELQENKKLLAEGVLNSTKKRGGAGLSVDQMKHLFDLL